MPVNTIEKCRLLKNYNLFLKKCHKRSARKITILIEPPISDPMPITEPAEPTMQPSPPELPPTILLILI
jgi:hypothetical protein